MTAKNFMWNGNLKKKQKKRAEGSAASAAQLSSLSYESQAPQNK
jgi:hypothetical protein